MTGEGRSFAGYTFHHVAIAAHGVDVEVEKLEAGAIVIRAQPFAGDGHAHAVSAALAERSGGGFDAGGYVRFRMARSFAVDLAKTLDLFHRERRFVEDFAVRRNIANSGEGQHRVKQHGSVAVRVSAARGIGP